MDVTVLVTVTPVEEVVRMNVTVVVVVVTGKFNFLVRKISNPIFRARDCPSGGRYVFMLLLYYSFYFSSPYLRVLVFLCSELCG